MVVRWEKWRLGLARLCRSGLVRGVKGIWMGMLMGIWIGIGM